MLKFTMQNAAISWPHKCVTCGGQATTRATARCSIVTDVGYYVLFARTKHRVISVDYPICTRHKIIATIAGRLSQRSLFNLGIGIIWAFVVFSLGIAYALLTYDHIARGQYLEGLGTLFTLLGIVGIGPLVFILVRFLTPVKVHSATDHASPSPLPIMIMRTSLNCSIEK